MQIWGRRVWLTRGNGVAWDFARLKICDVGLVVSRQSTLFEKGFTALLALRPVFFGSKRLSTNG